MMSRNVKHGGGGNGLVQNPAALACLYVGDDVAGEGEQMELRETFVVKRRRRLACTSIKLTQAITDGFFHVTEVGERLGRRQFLDRLRVRKNGESYGHNRHHSVNAENLAALRQIGKTHARSCAMVAGIFVRPMPLGECVCGIFVEAFVARQQQLEVERKRGIVERAIAARKAAGFVPKRSLGEMYAAKNCVGRVQKLLPVVGRIGYARH